MPDVGSCVPVLVDVRDVSPLLGAWCACGCARQLPAEVLSTGVPSTGRLQRRPATSHTLADCAAPPTLPQVARAHILAAETPAASGRYLVCHSHTTPPAQLTSILQVGLPPPPLQLALLPLPPPPLLPLLLGDLPGVGTLCPASCAACCLPPIQPATHPPTPTRAQEAFPAWRIQPGADCGGPKEVMDASKAARELGLAPRPLRETLADMARCLVALGVARPQLTRGA